MTVAEKLEYEKHVKLDTAYQIIGLLDEGRGTEWIDQAIEKLQRLKHVRENLPF